jgi:hypothetical protein
MQRDLQDKAVIYLSINSGVLSRLTMLQASASVKQSSGSSHLVHVPMIQANNRY